MSEMIIQGTIAQDAFHFSLPLSHKGNTANSPFILDTGAFELTVSQQTASDLGLPNLGSLTISGVTGSATAYTSEVDVQIAGQTFAHVSCVVDPSLAGTQLFGLRFFVDRQLQLALNTVAQTLTITPGASAPSNPSTPG